MENNASGISFDELRRLVRLVIWASLIAVGGWISIPVGGVPLSMQTFFVVLAGLVEGPGRGALACGLYLLAGLSGLPVFAGGVGGPAILFKPSVGYALSFPLNSALAGLASRTLNKKFSFAKGLFFSILGHLVMYFFGIMGVLVNSGVTPLLAASSVLMFVPGDMLKCAAASSLACSRLFNRVYHA